MSSMTAAELQETFQISREEWRRIATGTGMIKPINPQHSGGVTTWPVTAFARWLAAHQPDLAGHIPHLLRPAGKITQHYHGGTYTTSEPSGFPYEHFAGHWRTGYGRLVIVYPRRNPFGLEDPLAHHPDATTAVVIQNERGLHGLPDLKATDRLHPGLVYEPSWSEVAAHIGGPVPWWPSALQRRELLVAWTPGQQPEAVEVLTERRWESLYDMALREAEATPVRVACFSIGYEIREQAVGFVEREIAQLTSSDSSEPADWAAERASLTIPVFPPRDDPGQRETGSLETIREGVAQLWRRTDDLAVECLHEIISWSDRYAPFGDAFSVASGRETTDAGREWIRRLRDVEPTAIHRAMGQNRGEITGTLIDPATGSPVVAEKSYSLSRQAVETSYHSYAPRHLPAGSVIDEVILDEPVWVRTVDGTLYPLPPLGEADASFAYSGSGPGALARVIGRLLDDGSAHTLADSDGEPNLRAFLETDRPSGTCLSRRRLEEVRGRG